MENKDYIPAVYELMLNSNRKLRAKNMKLHNLIRDLDNNHVSSLKNIYQKVVTLKRKLLEVLVASGDANGQLTPERFNDQTRRLKTLEHENSKLGNLVDDLQYDNQYLKDQIAEMEDNPSENDADTYLNNLP